MITSEAEPMGGLMGDAVAQPAFQFGQMMTILIFLFAQSIWFGLASVALIPLQAWLIPRLQRQINLLNKDRIQEIRAFSSEIGETAAGISDLRANGGWRYRLAQFTDRLGRLFDIRFQIYQKKFFMKFLNNMIGHLTPFFFYSVGGYLAIQGDISGVTSSLGLAFNSTFIALLLSIGLMLLVHLLQSRQETLIIDIEDWVTKKVIGLMKTPTSEESAISFS